MTQFKPLLACEADLDKLKFPLLASPKLDGIRCIIHPDLGPVTRNLKPIANVALRERLAQLPAWLDGELVCGDPTAKDCMQRTTSAVMSSANDSSEVTYFVFDSVSNNEFEIRYDGVGHALAGNPGATVLTHERLNDMQDLSAYEERCVETGYEGTMLRDPDGKYKFGRSTVREGILLKVKRFSDMEGAVTGFVERMHNGNEATKDNLGRTKRSTAKANKVGRGDLGALILSIEGWPSATVEVGTGFTDEQRQRYWEDRDNWLGMTCTFKYQAAGSKDAPRFPVFKCWREDGV